MPGHLRYTCCPGTHATVVGFLLWDSTIRYVTRDALLAWPTTMLAWPTTKRCASHTRRLNERDRSLSIARGPLRAWRASAPARRRGTRAEYERESVNVTSVCGTTCERGGASLGARVGMSQVAALCCGTRSRRACSRSRRASSRARLARIAPDAARSSASRKSARSSVG